MSDITAVSLFGGIEGIGLALERCGVKVAATVEIDADCRAVIARHFPGTKLFNDVRTVTANDLRAAGFVPGRGLLAGGWPCQDLSIAGRRTGLAGARSGLFWQVVRLADELRPRWLILENVPGLLSAVCCCPGDDTCTANGRAVRCGRWDKRNGKRVWLDHVQHIPPGGACCGGCMPVHGGAMGTVVGALEQLGYGLCWRVLDSRFFDVPQRRERVFFVGCLGDGAAPVEVLFDPESGERDLAPGSAAWPGAAAGAPGGAGDARTVGTIGGTGPGGGWRVGADEAAAGQLIPLLEVNDRRGVRDDSRTGIGVGDAGNPMFTLQAGKQHGVAVPIQDGREMAKAQNGLGLGAEGDPSYTLDTTGGQAVATLQGGGRRGHRIDAEGAAGGHLIPFDTAQITSAENRSHPRAGDPAPTLNGTGAMCTPPVPFRVGAVPIALRGRDGGSQIEVGASGDPAFAIRTAGGGSSYPMVAHALTSEGADASEDGTGRAYGTSGVPRPVPSSLAVEPMTFNWQTDIGALRYDPTPGALQTTQTPAIHTSLAVRRLTPLECERLQGFPDDWTRWKVAGGSLAEQSDSARYRQIGNAVTTTVVEWIAARLVAADLARAREAGAA